MKVTIENLRLFGTSGLKVDVNITLFLKDFSTFLRASYLGMKDTSENSDYTNSAE